MSAEPSSVKRRLVVLVVSTLAGVAVGVSGDILADANAVSPSDVFLSLMFSPLAVTVGGNIVPTGALKSAFLIGGLLFWPVYFLCAWQ